MLTVRLVDDPQGVLKTTAKSPRVLSLDEIWKIADPPEFTVADAGVMVRLVGPEALTVPLRPTTVSVT